MEENWLTKAKRQAKFDLFLWTPLMLLNIAFDLYLWCKGMF